MEVHLYSNIWKVKLISFFWGFLMLTGVSVLFFNSRGLSISEIYMIQSIFTLTMSIFEIPTGYLSDLYGRKIILILAGLTKGIGGVLLAVGHDFVTILVSFIFLGIANSLLSGCNTALIYESLPEHEKERTSKILGELFFIGFISLSCATIIGGYVSHYSFNVAVWINAGIACCSFFVACSLKEPVKVTIPKKENNQDSNNFRNLSFFQNMLVLIHKIKSSKLGVKEYFILYIVYLFPVIISQYAFQERWKTLGVNLSNTSIIVAIIGFIGAFSGKYIHHIQKYIGIKYSFIMLVIFPIIAFFSASTPFISVVFIAAVLIGVVRALVQISILDRFNKAVDSDIRATANSLLSFLTRIFVFVGSLLFGILIEKQGDRTAFLVLAAIYTILPVIFYLFFTILGKRKIIYEFKTRSID